MEGEALATDMNMFRDMIGLVKYRLGIIETCSPVGASTRPGMERKLVGIGNGFGRKGLANKAHDLPFNKG
jgi:hypothetical protein